MGGGSRAGGEGERLVGIDAIRFVASLWVVLSHFGVPPLAGHGDGAVARLLAAGFGCLFNGPAAVVVFFVISGLCIHFPQRQGAALDVGRFYARRFLRILVPMGAAVGIAWLLPHGLDGLADVLWSLYCELIYYALYPVLLLAARRWGWVAVLSGSLVASAAVMATRPEARFLWEYGIGLTWLAALPCWVLGCMLAGSARPVPPTRAAMWSWRGAVLALSALQLVALFHTRFGLTFTLIAFACVAQPWLAREIAWLRERPPWGALERAGAWSYSLYLIHRIVQTAWPALGMPPGVASWTVSVATALLASCAFYFCCERPAHLLARSIRRRPHGAPSPPPATGGAPPA